LLVLKIFIVVETNVYARYDLIVREAKKTKISPNRLILVQPWVNTKPTLIIMRCNQPYWMTQTTDDYQACVKN